MPYSTRTEIFTDKVTVVNTPRVTLTLNADDWALYSDSDCYENTKLYANRESVADALNYEISNAINTSKRRGEAFNHCICIFERYSESGVNDTEGRDVLWDILNLTYGIGVD